MTMRRGVAVAALVLAAVVATWFLWPRAPSGSALPLATPDAEPADVPASPAPRAKRSDGLARIDNRIAATTQALEEAEAAGDAAGAARHRRVLERLERLRAAQEAPP